jgi:hypothetical protein
MCPLTNGSCPRRRLRYSDTSSVRWPRSNGLGGGPFGLQHQRCGGPPRTAERTPPARGSTRARAPKAPGTNPKASGDPLMLGDTVPDPKAAAAGRAVAGRRGEEAGPARARGVGSLGSWPVGRCCRSARAAPTSRPPPVRRPPVRRPAPPRAPPQTPSRPTPASRCCRRTLGCVNACLLRHARSAPYRRIRRVGGALAGVGDGQCSRRG